jgi:hypothetical protein
MQANTSSSSSFITLFFSMADAVGTILQVRFGAELYNGFGRS